MRPRVHPWIASGTGLLTVALVAHLWMFSSASPSAAHHTTGSGQHQVVLPDTHDCPGGMAACEVVEPDAPRSWLLGLLVSPLVVAAATRGAGRRAARRVRVSRDRPTPTPVTDAVVLLE